MESYYWYCNTWWREHGPILYMYDADGSYGSSGLPITSSALSTLSISTHYASFLDLSSQPSPTCRSYIGNVQECSSSRSSGYMISTAMSSESDQISSHTELPKRGKTSTATGNQGKDISSRTTNSISPPSMAHPRSSTPTKQTIPASGASSRTPSQTGP